MRSLLLCGVCFLGLAGSAFGSTVTFPSGLIPFDSIDYITPQIPGGDRLVVGEFSPAAFGIILNMTPGVGNEQFSDASIQLAPGVFFSNVYVPTSDELSGIFTAFGGLLKDPYTMIPGLPWTGMPFVGGRIPQSRLGNPFAFRIGAPNAPTPTPEPSLFALLTLSLFPLLTLVAKRKFAPAS